MKLHKLGVKVESGSALNFDQENPLQSRYFNLPKFGEIKQALHDAANIAIEGMAAIGIKLKCYGSWFKPNHGCNFEQDDDDDYEAHDGQAQLDIHNDDEVQLNEDNYHLNMQANISLWS